MNVLHRDLNLECVTSWRQGLSPSIFCVCFETHWPGRDKMCGTNWSGYFGQLIVFAGSHCLRCKHGVIQRA